jgi:NAD(P)-dependent dehydrogenase (short-subunit alcohol dehydrogenase family)
MGVPLEGRTAIVTGGGSGIGRAIASAFAAEGAHVVIAGRSPDRLHAAATALGVTAVPTNVTDEDEVAGLFAATVERHGSIDVLVNSAGAFAGDLTDEQDVAAFRHVRDTNVVGTFVCAREAFRHMRGRGGRIINIGSIAARRVRAQSTAYSASKHAVWGLTQALALDGRDDGIVVSCLNPGNTLVERRASSAAQSGRSEGTEPMMAVEEVARVAVLMATLDPEINLLEALVLPDTQAYVGRG